MTASNMTRNICHCPVTSDSQNWPTNSNEVAAVLLRKATTKQYFTSYSYQNITKVRYEAEALTVMQ